MRFRKNAWYRVGSTAVLERLLTNDVPSGLKFFKDKKWHQCTRVDKHGVEGFASFQDSKNPDKLWDFNKYSFLELVENDDPALDDILEASARSSGRTKSKLPVDSVTEKSIVVSVSPETSDLRNQLRKEMGFKMLAEFDRMVYQKGVDRVMELYVIGSPVEEEIDPGNEFPNAVDAREEGKKNSKEYSRDFLMERVLPKIKEAIDSGMKGGSLEEEGILTRDIEEFLKGKGYRVKDLLNGKIRISW